jgi:hypothetical protein
MAAVLQRKRATLQVRANSGHYYFPAICPPHLDPDILR